MFLNQAPEFRNIKGWINSKPLQLKDLKGKVILLDFWTYSCVNCLRTLPHIKELYQKYRDYNFVLIGVHSPEFDFERIAANVEMGVKKLKIPYPVALDSGNSTWIAFGNRYWPRQTLIDSKGRIVWEHTGEGGYAEMEEWIRKLLELSGQKVKPEKPVEEDDESLSRFGISAEIYAGSERNQGLGSSGVCGADGVCRYLDQAKEHERDVLYPDGEWVQKREALKHAGKDGYLILRYRGREVNAVMDGDTDVEVLIDNQTAKQIKVNSPEMYTLHKTKSQEEHELKIVAKGMLSVYAFTFG